MTTSTGPPGRGDKADGLKTHISTAFSGLLDRALNNQLEKERGPGSSVHVDRPSSRRPDPAYTSELAKQVRRLIGMPSPARLVLQRATERTAGVPGTLQPYCCFYCESRFDRESTLNRHMGRAHRNEMICPDLKREESEDDPDDVVVAEDADCSWQEPNVTIWTPETPDGDLGGDGDFLCSESVPSAEESSASEYPTGSDGWPVPTGVEVTGSGSGPSETVHSPRAVPCPHCGELLAGKDALAMHVAEEHLASTSLTGSTTSVTQSGRSDEVKGLKTHISTAFGGLLERALNNRFEKGLDPGGSIHSPSPPGSSSTGRCRRVYNNELATQVRQQLTSKPPRTRTVSTRRAAIAVGESDLLRYSCFYCEKRFDLQMTQQWHMMQEHKHEMFYLKSKRPAYEPDRKDESGSRDSARNPMPPAEESPASPECPVGSDNGPAESDSGSGGSGSGPSVPGTTAAEPAAGTSVDSPPTPACPHCGELLAGEDALAAHVVEEHLAGVVTTDSAPSTGPHCRGDESLGLKIHISTALGGLLDRAVGDRTENGFGPGGSAHHPGPKRPKPSRRHPARPALRRATTGAVGKSALPRYVCLYCESRFQSMSSQRWHMIHKHSNELMASQWKMAAPPEDDSDDMSDNEDSNSDSDMNLSTVQEVQVHGEVEHARPEPLPQVSSPPRCSGAAASGRTTPVSPLDGETVKHEVEMVPFASPNREIETIFIKEESPFAHEWESTDDLDTARDPLSIEEETDTLADDPLPISEPQSIKVEVLEDLVPVSQFISCVKEDPDIDVGVDASDSIEAATRGHTSDIARTAGLTSTGVSVSEFGSTARAVPDSSHLGDGPGEADTSPPNSVTPPCDTAARASESDGTDDGGYGAGDTRSWETVTGSAVGEAGEEWHSGDADTRPPFCYAELIAMAIANSPHRRAKLSEICDYIRRNFPYFERNKKGWQKSIRVNLSYHRCFVKVPLDRRVRNNYWTVDPKYEAMFETGNFRRHPLVKQYFCGDPGAADTPAAPLDTYAAYYPNDREHQHRQQQRQQQQHHRAALSVALGLQAAATAEAAGEDVDVGGAAVLSLASPHNDTYEHRSTQISDGNYSASFEENKLRSDEVVTEREKSAHFISDSVTNQGITSREDNSFCSTDDMSLTDNNFPVFTCSSCLQSFSSKYSLIMHVFIHIDNVEPPLHVCRYCGEVFLSDNGLKNHLRRKDNDRTLTAHPSADSRKVCSSSDICKDALTSKDHMPVSSSAITGNNSYERVTNVDCTSQEHCCKSSDCSVCQNKSKLLSTSLVHKKPYKCNMCSKSFAFACYLKKRDVLDSGIKPHKCEVCGKLFAKVYDLKVHLLVHYGLKSLNCDVCGKSFATVEELKSHSVVHCEVNSYKCDICGKSFATPASLKSHAVVHSVVESHRCDDCGKLFARVGKFELHLSEPSGVKSLSCSVCSKSFKSALNLKRHMKVHSQMKGL